MSRNLVTLKSTGNTKKTKSFLTRMKQRTLFSRLDYYGKLGVQALSQAMPVDTGETAASWSYKIEQSDGSMTLTWTNSAAVDGIPIVVLIQYGHGTRNGGYVQPYDFINPALRDVFDEIADSAWKEVVRR